MYNMFIIPVCDALRNAAKKISNDTGAGTGVIFNHVCVLLGRIDY